MLAPRSFRRDGLSAFWSFREGSGTTVSDNTVGANTATLVNSPTWTAQGVDFASASSQHATTTRTISATGGALCVVFKGDTVGSNRSVAGLMAATNGRLFIGTANGSNLVAAGIGTTGNGTAVGTTTLVADTWYMLTITWGANGETARFWLGQTLEYSAAQSGSVNSATNLAIGARNTNGTIGNYWDGPIALVALYNRTIGGSAVRQNYRAARRLMASRGVALS